MGKLPVLMIVFNRPETTERVFEAVRQYAPERLYVSADGPRPDRPDAERCAEVRKIFDRVDWPCEVKTRFRDVNMGCRKVSSEMEEVLCRAELGSDFQYRQSEGAALMMDFRTANPPAQFLPESLWHPAEIRTDDSNDLRLFNLVRNDWKDRVRFLPHCLTGKDCL